MIEDKAMAARGGREVEGIEAAADALDEWIRKVISDYQLLCDLTASEYAEDESESGQQMYWRADGASDALDQLLAIFTRATRAVILTELKSAAMVGACEERSRILAMPEWARSDVAIIEKSVLAVLGWGK